jgi:hypothetical protein
MSSKLLPLIVLSASLQLLPGAEQTNIAPENAPARQRKNGATNAFTYTFPDRGAPKIRVNGGSRAAGHLPRLYVLAPDQTGFTTNEQPVLYWYQSKKADFPTELTISKPREIDPLLRITLDPPQEAGFHKFELARSGTKLAPGTDYRWSVALIVNAKSRSKDVVATGAIRRITLPPPVASAVTTAPDPEAAAALLASNGIWYDAIHILSRLIETQPENTHFRQLRANLLEQVALAEPASHDRSGTNEPKTP